MQKKNRYLNKSPYKSLSTEDLNICFSHTSECFLRYFLHNSSDDQQKPLKFLLMQKLLNIEEYKNFPYISFKLSINRQISLKSYSCDRYEYKDLLNASNFISKVSKEYKKLMIELILLIQEIHNKKLSSYILEPLCSIIAQIITLNIYELKDYKMKEILTTFEKLIDRLIKEIESPNIHASDNGTPHCSQKERNSYDFKYPDLKLIFSQNEVNTPRMIHQETYKKKKFNIQFINLKVLMKSKYILLKLGRLINWFNLCDISKGKKKEPKIIKNSYIKSNDFDIIFPYSSSKGHLLLDYQNRIYKEFKDKEDNIDSELKILQKYFIWKLNTWKKELISPQSGNSRRGSGFKSPQPFQEDIMVCKICLNDIPIDKMPLHSELCMERYKVLRQIDSLKAYFNRYCLKANKNARYFEKLYGIEKKNLVKKHVDNPVKTDIINTLVKPPLKISKSAKNLRGRLKIKIFEEDKIIEQSSPDGISEKLEGFDHNSPFRCKNPIYTKDKLTWIYRKIKLFDLIAKISSYFIHEELDNRKIILKLNEVLAFFKKLQENESNLCLEIENFAEYMSLLNEYQENGTRYINLMNKLETSNKSPYTAFHSHYDSDTTLNPSKKLNKNTSRRAIPILILPHSKPPHKKPKAKEFTLILKRTMSSKASTFKRFNSANLNQKTVMVNKNFKKFENNMKVLEKTATNLLRFKTSKSITNTKPTNPLILIQSESVKPSSHHDKSCSGKPESGTFSCPKSPHAMLSENLKSPPFLKDIWSNKITEMMQLSVRKKMTRKTVKLKKTEILRKKTQEISNESHVLKKNEVFSKELNELVDKEENFLINNLLGSQCGYFSDSCLESTGSRATKVTNVSINDFEYLRLINKGAFGRVWLVKRKFTNDLYAMKIVDIMEHVRNKKDIKTLKAESEIYDVLSSDFVVKALFKFTYETFLCFVTEYMIGGDFGYLLHQYTALDESIAKFYLAELILAIDHLHHLNIIHRDLKPDNILLDRNGHIKLTDFGLSEMGFTSQINDKAIYSPKSPELNYQLKPQVSFIENKTTHTSKFGKKFFNPINSLMSLEEEPTLFQDSLFANANANSLSSNKMLSPLRKNIGSLQKRNKILGTPDYIAPEILLEGEGVNSKSVDWWALGVMIFEFIVGMPPFNADTIDEIFANIKALNIPWTSLTLGYGENEMTPEAKDLIERLLKMNPNERITKNGSEELRKHVFFEGIDWENLRTTNAPIIPQRKPDESVTMKKFTEQEINNPFFKASGNEMNEKETYMMKTLIQKNFNFDKNLDIRYDLLDRENKIEALEIRIREKKDNKLDEIAENMSPPIISPVFDGQERMNFSEREIYE